MRRVIPAAFVVVALLYLALALSYDERRMIGDEKGWDPGPRALPLATGALMLVLGIYLAAREGKSRARSAALPPAVVRLVVFTVVLCCLYVALFRAVGFVLATALLLYLLFFFYREQDVRPGLLAPCLKGLAGSLALTLAVYTTGKAVTRALFAYGRSSGRALLADRTFGAGAALLAAAFVFMLVLLALKAKRGKGPLDRLSVSVLTAAAMTESLYVVFRQVFLVALAPGLLWW